MRRLRRDTGARRPARTPFAGAAMAGLAMVALSAVSVTAQEPSPTGSTPSWVPAPSSAVREITREITRDSFDTPGAWWTGADDVGTSTIADGRMRWTVIQDGRSIWDAPELPVPLEGVRVDAMVLVESGVGAGGALCAGPDIGAHAIWAGLNGDDQWLVGRIVDSRVQVIERGELFRVLGDTLIGAPEPLHVTLACTMAPDGKDHYAVWIEGVQVADGVDEPYGPFEHAGLMATADTAGLSVLFDDFAVFGGPEASGSPEASTTAEPGASASPSPSSVPAA